MVDPHSHEVFEQRTSMGEMSLRGRHLRSEISRAFGVILGQVSGYRKVLSCRKKKYIGFQIRKVAHVSQFFYLKSPHLYKYFLINLTIYFKVNVLHLIPFCFHYPFPLR